MLRATSLDELPQLWSVLRGDMSLIGPRPLPIKYVPRYSPEQRRRLEATPGITGWAQVQGRNSLAWPDKLAFDVWYVDHASLTGRRQDRRAHTAGRGGRAAESPPTGTSRCPSSWARRDPGRDHAAASAATRST